MVGELTICGDRTSSFRSPQVELRSLPVDLRSLRGQKRCRGTEKVPGQKRCRESFVIVVNATKHQFLGGGRLRQVPRRAGGMGGVGGLTLGGDALGTDAATMFH